MKRSKFAPITAAVLIGLGVTVTAKADVMGASVLLVHDAQIIGVDAPGGERTFLVDASGGGGGDFSFLTGNNNANVSASLASVPGAATAEEPSAGISPIDLDQVSQGTVPPALAPNNFTGLTNPASPQTATEPSQTNPLADSTLVDINLPLAGNPVAGGPDIAAPPPTFAIADQLLSGGIVDIDLDGDGVADVTGGADASLRSDSAIATTDSGDATSNVGAGFTFELVLDQDATIRFDALFSGNAEVWVSDDAEPISSAQASYSFIFDIVDENGNSVLGGGWSPFVVQDINRNTGLPGFTTRDYYTGAVDSSPEAVLVANTRYLVSLRGATQTDVTNRVPAPATLLLMAIGLLGIGQAARRRRS